MTDDLEHRFNYHQPRNRHIVRLHEIVREMHKELAKFVDGTIPDSRERSLAITNIEQSMFWCNAAVARIMNYQEPYQIHQGTTSATEVTYDSPATSSTWFKALNNDYEGIPDTFKIRLCPECHLRYGPGEIHTHD